MAWMWVWEKGGTKGVAKEHPGVASRLLPGNWGLPRRAVLAGQALCGEQRGRPAGVCCCLDYCLHLGAASRS